MSSFNHFLPYVSKQKKLYILGFVGSLFRFLIPLCVPLVIKYLFDELLQNETLSYAAKIQQLLLIAAIMLVVFFLIRGPMEYVIKPITISSRRCVPMLFIKFIPWIRSILQRIKAGKSGRVSSTISKK
ncbi:hypothetical protein [Paenibacillus sp. tmac-D7]|uniref:hypothetical protein n=1 Tax=Paenibacillus sp. tmac-D7 TaxID=2591462 RepID=UPI00215A6988|nr:hypothetical protein [Paenibacillus sp. tmac-D7]